MHVNHVERKVIDITERPAALALSALLAWFASSGCAQTPAPRYPDARLHPVAVELKPRLAVQRGRTRVILDVDLHNATGRTIDAAGLFFVGCAYRGAELQISNSEGVEVPYLGLMAPSTAGVPGKPSEVPWPADGTIEVRGLDITESYAFPTQPDRLAFSFMACADSRCSAIMTTTRPATMHYEPVTRVAGRTSASDQGMVSVAEDKATKKATVVCGEPDFDEYERQSAATPQPRPIDAGHGK